MCYSIASDYGLSGLRLGCAIVNPRIPEWKEVVKRIGISERSLGFWSGHHTSQDFFAQYTTDRSKGSSTKQTRNLQDRSDALKKALFPRGDDSEFQGLGNFAFLGAR
jgi:hypothetical protein